MINNKNPNSYPTIKGILLFLPMYISLESNKVNARNHITVI